MMNKKTRKFEFLQGLPGTVLAGAPAFGFMGNDFSNPGESYIPYLHHFVGHCGVSDSATK